MDIRSFMKDSGIRYLLVNSTNEFLVEYNSLEQNSRYKLTNFSGSTGEALVTPETIYLFVDGRYHIQADMEVNHEDVTVVKLLQGQKYLEELINRIPEDEVLCVFSKKNSQKKVEQLATFRKIKLLDVDPFDEGVKYDKCEYIQLDRRYTGLSVEEKIKKFTKNISKDEALYLTDLDEVSYLFNIRDFSKNYSSKVEAKAIVSADKSQLFLRENFKELEDILKNSTKKFLVDKSAINAYDYKLIMNSVKELFESPLRQMKSQKTDAEIEHLKDAFAKTDNAVRAIREFILNNESISEYDISKQLEYEFKKQGAKNLSFQSIVAKDKNSALAHYSKSSKDEIITDGSLVLIDCGAYFEGGLATDITRVFVKGEPSKLHKKIYTYVIKAFLKAYNYCKNHNSSNLTGYDIDKSVHEFFEGQNLDGFVFNHGLGHGIGVNVHEYPPNLSTSEIAKVQLVDGECFTIEPGLYKEGEFGIRLENSCYFKDGEIHSFVKMNYEDVLIDYDMLTLQEKEWLKEFEVK